MSSVCLSNESQNGAEFEPLASCVKSGEQQTIAKKHNLISEWTFWFNMIQSNVDWTDSLKEINTFRTVEDFWCLYSNIKPVDELAQLLSKFEFSLFRKGVEPMAESPVNRKGGRIIIGLEKFPMIDIDDVWLDSMLLLIGEMVDVLSEFNGVVLSMKPRQPKLAFWTRCCDAEKIESLRKRISKYLPNLQSFPMPFSEHKIY